MEKISRLNRAVLNFMTSLNSPILATVTGATSLIGLKTFDGKLLRYLLFLNRPIKQYSTNFIMILAQHELKFATN